MRRSFETGLTRPLAKRREVLKAMLRMFQENQEAILDAIYKDLRRPSGEALYYDYLMPVSKLRELIANLKRWTASERVGEAAQVDIMLTLG